jgi:hypothetical protein
LPAGQALPAGFSINQADPRYKALVDLATREKWSQAAFSSVLGIEAQRVSAAHAAAAQAAQPTTTPNKIEGYESMTFAQRWAAGEAKRAGGPKP